MLSNPLSYTDPTGELTQAQWDQAATMIDNMLNDTGGGGSDYIGGYIGGDMATPATFTSQDQALVYGIGYMNTHNAWGGGDGWAGSAQEAVANYMASGASEGTLQFRYSSESAGTFLTHDYRGSSAFDNYLGQTYTLIGVVGEGFDVAFNSNASNSSENLLSWAQTGLDILGSTEIPILSQIGDIGSGIISATQGDWVGAGMSLGGAVIPGLSQAKLARSAVKAVNSSAHLSTNSIKLAKQLASEAQMAEKGITIIGPGKLNAATRLAREYGGNAADWVKKSSSSFTKNGATFETHWYENISTGLRTEFKTKFP